MSKTVANWVPVTNGLPDRDEVLLMIIKRLEPKDEDEAEVRWMVMGKFDPGIGWDTLDETWPHFDWAVTHWAYRPEFPE